MARHTSERERRANDAERELVQWKKVRFMADKVGDEFEGYITGVTAFGLFIELIEHFVEGMVHVSTMADDYYRFIERAHILRGENTGRVYRLGDRVARAGHQGRHGAAADRSRPGRHSRARAARRSRTAGRAAAQRRAEVGAAHEGGQAQAAAGQARAPATQARSLNANCRNRSSDRRRHGRPHRSRQERAGAGADRDRSRSAEGREGARDHDRPRVRARARSAASTWRSSTCPGTSASSRTCWPASAASTPCCWSSPPTSRSCRRRASTSRSAGCCTFRAGVIALTKADLVDADTLELARLEARELVGGIAARGRADRRRCRRGPAQGLDALRKALAAIARPARRRARRTAPPRLPIDRVFSMRGFGTVVTGTLTSGTLRVDDELVVLPPDAPRQGARPAGARRGAAVGGRGPPRRGEPRRRRRRRHQPRRHADAPTARSR